MVQQQQNHRLCNAKWNKTIGLALLSFRSTWINKLIIYLWSIEQLGQSYVTANGKIRVWVVRNIIRSMGVALSKHGIHYRPNPYLEYTPYTPNNTCMTVWVRDCYTKRRTVTYSTITYRDGLVYSSKSFFSIHINNIAVWLNICQWFRKRFDGRPGWPRYVSLFI